MARGVGPELEQQRELLLVVCGRGTETADLINTYIKEGKIVPAAITVGRTALSWQRHKAWPIQVHLQVAQCSLGSVCHGHTVPAQRHVSLPGPLLSPYHWGMRIAAERRACAQVGLLRAAMEESPRRKFLIDGFPRNIENLNVWIEVGAGG
jgi:hypothetical protein